MIKSYQIIEKLDLDFLSKVTGIAKNHVEQLFEVGDHFRISNKKYKIIHKTEEDNNRFFICQVWQ